MESTCTISLYLRRYVVGGCEVLWAIKDRSIGHTFFDEGAAVFFLPHLVSETTSESLEPSKHVAAGDQSAGHVTEISPLKRLKYALDKRPGPDPSTKEGGWSKGTAGGALGPDWHSDLKMTGKAFDEVRWDKLVSGGGGGGVVTS